MWMAERYKDIWESLHWRKITKTEIYKSGRLWDGKFLVTVNCLGIFTAIIVDHQPANFLWKLDGNILVFSGHEWFLLHSFLCLCNLKHVKTILNSVSTKACCRPNPWALIYLPLCQNLEHSSTVDFGTVLVYLYLDFFNWPIQFKSALLRVNWHSGIHICGGPS